MQALSVTQLAADRGKLDAGPRVMSAVFDACVRWIRRHEQPL